MKKGFEKKSIFVLSTLILVILLLPLFISAENYGERIEISKAQHTISYERSISDIYDSVSKLDGVWSETINPNEYIKITFEENLTKENDITIYPRVVNGSPKIEVYNENGRNLIAEFTLLRSNEYNKIYLNNLKAEGDTFYLKVLNGSVEFDYITDPTGAEINVQRGTVTMTTLNRNITINPVNTSRAIILLSTRSSSSTPNILQVTANFVNSTTIKFDKYSTTSTTLEWEVIENSDFLVQRGERSYLTTDSSLLENINSVNLSNSFIILTNRLSDATAGNNVRGFWTGQFSGSSNLVFSRDVSGSLGVLSWQVVEFNGANVQSGSIAASSSPAYVNINAINLSQSFIILSKRSTTTSAVNTMVQGFFINETRAAFRRYGTTGTTTVFYFIVSSPDLITQTENYRYGSSTAAQNRAINSVNMSRSFTLNSWDFETATTTYGRAFVTNRLTSSTNLELRKGVSTSNVNNTWFVISFKDLDPPSLILNNPKNKTYGSSDFPLLINLTLSEKGGNVFYSLDQGKTNYSMNTSDNINYNLTISSLIEDNYNLRIYANDSSGNRNDSQSVFFSVDLTPPNILVFDPEEKYYNALPINFNITSDEKSTANYSLNGINYTLSVNELGTEFFSSNYSISDGSYFVNYYVWDLVGNLNSTIKLNFTLDTTFPLIDFEEETETSDSNKSRNWIYVNVSVVEENEANITFDLYNSLGLVNSSTYTNGIREINWTGLSDGEYWYNVSVFDFAGNLNYTQTRKITLDRTGPSIVLYEPEPRTYAKNISLPLNYTILDSNSLSACWWNLDSLNNNSISCAQNTTFDASEGLHRLNFYSNDSLGNLGYSKVDFDVSLSGVAVELENPLNNSYLTHFDIQFDYVPKAGLGLDVCTLYGTWGGWHANYTEYSPLNWTTNSFFANLEEGDYTWNIWCNDSDGGNNFALFNRSITIDLTPPLIDFEEETETSDSNKSRNWIYVNVSVVEENEANITFNLYDSSGLIHEDSFNDKKMEINWTGLSDGEYWYNVSVFDLAGNLNYTQTRKITLDTLSPEIFILHPENLSYNINNLDFNYTVYDENVETCFWTDNFGIENHSISCEGNMTYLANQGSTTIILYSIDFAGNLNFSQIIFFVDSVFPGIEFVNLTEQNNTEIERDWIYVNVSVVEENEANITFNLYNSSGLVNSSTYTNGIREINWTNLSSVNITYFYNVSAFDLTGNLNYTQTRKIKLTDLTPPALILNEPKNKTYYTNSSLLLDFSVTDLNLDKCWYNLNEGMNITLSNCNSSTFDCAEGQNTLSLYSNDSVGNVKLSSVTFIANESLLSRRAGILAYGEGTIQNPRYRLWNGKIFSSELSANSVGGTIEWIKVKSSPVRNENLLVTADSADDINIQINSSLANGTSCWHNGTHCGSVLEVSTVSTTVNRQKVDVAYETLSGDALVVWSQANITPAYKVWNGINWSSTKIIPQTLIVSGDISYLKLASHPFKDEIALIISNTTALNVLIWNGTDWGCEPSSLLSVILTPEVYQHADLAYEQISGDLFIASSINGITGIDYITKQDESCTYLTTRYTLAEESEQISIGAKYGSDYIMINQRDVGSDDIQAVVWDGNSMLAKSGNELTTYTGDGSPSLEISSTWTGLGDYGLAIYSDAITSLNLNYLRYNMSTNGWEGAALGINATGLTAFSDEEQNIISSSFIGENKTMVIIKDDADDLWAKIYDGDNNLWTQPDGGVAFETTVSSTTWPSFDFYFDYDIAGPLIKINTPIHSNSSDVLFNISLSEPGVLCLYQIEGDEFISMTTSNSLAYTSLRQNLSDGEYNVSFICEDKWENKREISEVFLVDTIYPSIGFVNLTEQNNTEIERDWIYVNVSVVEENEANITFDLYNSLGLVNSSTYTNGIREINWTGLYDGEYWYNVSVFDLAGNLNYTQTRIIKLVMIPPVVNLIYPEKNYNLSGYIISQFNYSVTDNSSIANCSLYGNWSGAWHLNQTVQNPIKDIQNSFESINTEIDGVYSWNVECVDAYNNKGINLTNYTFASFLPPEQLNSSSFIFSQSKNDGTGEVFLSWNSSAHAYKYKIYYTSNILNNFSLLGETFNLNYTDTSANQTRRRFYKISAWNPSSEELNEDIIGKTVYYLKSKTNVNTKNWIGIYLGSNLTHASAGLDAIPNITSFTMWNSTIQKKLTCNTFSCPTYPICTETNCDFELSKGIGYEVNLNLTSPSFTNWSLIGLVNPKTNVSLIKNSSSFGKNWVSLYYNSSFDKAEDLISAASFSDVVTNWDEFNQTSQGYIPSPVPWIPYIGINFLLEPEKGYEVSVKQNSTYIQV